MQSSPSRWSTVAVVAAIGIMSFAGCKSTTHHMSRMPGMGWLAKDKSPDLANPSGVPIPPASVALPAGAQNPGAVTPVAGGPVPNFANPAYTAANPNAARPTSGYPLNHYDAGTRAASQPWNTTAGQPATGVPAPQRGTYSTDGYASTQPQPNYSQPAPSQYAPSSQYDTNADYARTADLRNRYGATATAPQDDRWGGAPAATAEQPSTYRDTAPTGYDRPAAPATGERTSRYSDGGSTAEATAPAASEPQQPYPRTDARADYLSPVTAPTQPPERATTTGGTHSNPGWYPGSTGRYEGAPAGGSTGTIQPAKAGPVAPASYSNPSSYNNPTTSASTERRASRRSGRRSRRIFPSKRPR